MVRFGFGNRADEDTPRLIRRHLDEARDCAAAFRDAVSSPERVIAYMNLKRSAGRLAEDIIARRCSRRGSIALVPNPLGDHRYLISRRDGSFIVQEPGMGCRHITARIVSDDASPEQYVRFIQEDAPRLLSGALS